MSFLQRFTSPVFAGFLLLLVIGLYVISLPEMLFGWDERFHALVAQNLSNDIFPPKLYAEKVISDYDHGPWYRSHVWLHKPPLFTYQIALFFKIFGSSLFVLRLNSLVMWLLLYFALYGSGRHSGLGKLASTILAVIFCTSPLLLSLMNGSQGMDHNDITFLAYIAVSFYFLSRYYKEPVWQTAVMIGVFAGLAILTKWLAGLLVFLPYGLSMLSERSRQSAIHFLVAFICCIAVLIPWHLLVYSYYLDLYLLENKHNSLHFTEVVEGHYYDYRFHITNWYWLLKPAFVLLLAGIPLLIIPLKKRDWKSVGLLVAVLFVFAFFTLASTKLVAFSIIAIPPLALYTSRVLSHFRNKLVLLILFVISLLSVRELYKWHTNQNYSEEYALDLRKKEYYQSLNESLPENAVIFNASDFEYPEAMYFSKRIVYEKEPSVDWLEEAKAKGYEPFIIVRDSANFNFEQLGQYKLLPYYE